MRFSRKTGFSNFQLQKCPGCSFFNLDIRGFLLGQKYWEFIRLYAIIVGPFLWNVTYYVPTREIARCRLYIYNDRQSFHKYRQPTGGKEIEKITGSSLRRIIPKITSFYCLNDCSLLSFWLFSLYYLLISSHGNSSISNHPYVTKVYNIIL